MRLIFLSFSLLLSATSLGALQAQSLQLRKANNLFKDASYQDAIFLYEKLLKKKDSVEAKVQLGATYFKLNQPKEAAYWYGQVFDALDDYQAYEYGNSLKILGKIEQAKAVFLQIPPSKELAIKKQLESCEKYSFLSTNPNIYTVRILNINTPKSDFAPVFYKDGLVFTTKTPINNLPNAATIFSLFKADMIDKSPMAFEQPTPFFKQKRQYIQQKNYIQPTTIAFSSSFDTIYFTGSSYTLKNNKSLINNGLQIYQQYKTADQETWEVPTLLPFNKETDTFAHPTLTEDGKTMYVVADIPGGYGSTDIYVTSQSNGSWTKLENLGPKINTSGRETFPFISSDNILYFSSDTHAGLGGLDVFYSKNIIGKQWTIPENLRPPINTPYDDFGFIIDEKQKSGYFSSNRAGGQGKDDIYYFATANSIIAGTTVCQLKGKVSSENGKRLKNVKITVQNQKTGESQVTRTERDGTYQVQLLTDASYTLTMEQAFCLTHTQELNLDKERIKEVNVNLYQFEIKDTKTNTLNNPIRIVSNSKNLYENFSVPTIDPIYYDLVNHTVCDNQERTIGDLVFFLQTNPSVVMEIGVHTSSRGAAITNKEIALQRAQNLAQYLINRGIPSKQLVAIGYGETEIINHCTDNVPCSDIEHAVNNRTEFIVKKYLLNDF